MQTVTEGTQQLKPTCRSCQKPILPEDINLNTVLAKCRSCHAVFDISEQITPPKVSESKRKRDGGEIPMPKQFSVEEESGRLSISYSWTRDYWAMVVPIFFAIFIPIFLGTMLTAFMMSSRNLEMNAFVWLMIIFGMLLLSIGIRTVWLTLGLLLNRTMIQVEGRRLRILHGPILWPGNHDLDTTSFDQLYCEECDSSRYALMVRCKDGTRLRLVKGMGEVEQVLILERLIEKHLGIADRPVRGELQDGFTS